MTKTNEKNELIVHGKTHPESYFGEMENYFDRLFRHPFSMLHLPSSMHLIEQCWKFLKKYHRWV